MSSLRIFQTATCVRTLGPGLRFCLWVQGCCRRCPGCASPEGQSLKGGYEIPVERLAEIILAHAAAEALEGITISGGEPYLQSEALCSLLGQIKNKRDLGVILYTGFSFDRIADDPLTKLCDVVIDGAYLAELDDDASLRGSANQQAIFCTERYRNSLAFGGPQRHTELVNLLEGGVALVGIPSAYQRRQAAGITNFLTAKESGTQAAKELN